MLEIETIKNLQIKKIKDFFKVSFFLFRMGLEQSDIDEVQKSWDIAKSAAKLRYR